MNIDNWYSILYWNMVYSLTVPLSCDTSFSEVSCPHHQHMDWYYNTGYTVSLFVCFSLFEDLKKNVEEFGIFKGGYYVYVILKIAFLNSLDIILTIKFVNRHRFSIVGRIGQHFRTCFSHSASFWRLAMWSMQDQYTEIIYIMKKKKPLQNKSTYITCTHLYWYTCE